MMALGMLWVVTHDAPLRLWVVTHDVPLRLWVVTHDAPLIAWQELLGWLLRFGWLVGWLIGRLQILVGWLQLIRALEEMIDSTCGESLSRSCTGFCLGTQLLLSAVGRYCQDQQPLLLPPS